MYQLFVSVSSLKLIYVFGADACYFKITRTKTLCEIELTKYIFFCLYISEMFHHGGVYQKVCGK